MNKRDQAIADVNAATAADNGVIKNQPLLYLYAVEQREKLLIARDALRECINSFNMTRRLIMHEDARKQVAELLADYRAALEETA